MTTYRAKKSNLKDLLSKSPIDLNSLEQTTGISKSDLNEYMTKKVMSLNAAMTISRELNCQIEDLYVWKKVE